MKYFTKQQIEEIRKQLATLGVRDTDLPFVGELTGDETVAIVQNGENKQVTIRQMIHDYLPDDIADGKDGASAYDLWKMAGNTGTVLDFLNSLKGKKGDTGSIGPQGPAGPVGPAGPQGPKGEPGSGIEWRAATSTALGGIKIGHPDQSGRNFGVKLNSSNQAYVTVPADAGGTGQEGGYYEQVFRAFAHNATVTDQDLPGSSIDDVLGPWKHFVDDNEATTTFGSSYSVWMAIRWVNGSSVGQWRGPWNITGADGLAGADGTDIEFIYTRTADESESVSTPTYSQQQASDSIAKQQQSTEAPSGQTSVNKADWYPIGWTDNPQGVTSTMRIEWMSFRIKTGGAGGQGGTWQSFSAPVVWSAYGRQGLDGDGVEYIFAVSSTVPSEDNDPNTWAGVDTTVTPNVWVENVGYQNREYIPTGSQGLWKDNPVDLSTYAQGAIQWVSMRKKYADSAPGIAPYYTTPYWHEYCTPRLWNYKAKDGVASAAVVSLEPDMFYIPCNGETGLVSDAFTGTTRLTVQYAGQILQNVSISTSGITIKDTSSSQTSYSSSWVSVNGNNISIAIPNSATVDFRSTQLVVRIPVSCTVNGNTLDLEATLLLVGNSIGKDGTSYSIKTSSGIVTIHDGSYSTSSIDVSVVVNRGRTLFGEYTVTGTGNDDALSDLGSAFSLRYFVGNDTEHMVTMNTNSIPTTGLTGSITVQLVYGLMTIVQEYIPIIEEPLTQPTQQILKSIVFKRSATQPERPGNSTVLSLGTGVNSYLNPSYGGTFERPVPFGWSDGLPAYEEDTRIWMSTRIFTNDGQAPQQSAWTAPKPASDSDNFDIEFAYQQVSDAVPNVPYRDGTLVPSATTNNRHIFSEQYKYGHSAQIWFDPDDDKYDGQNHPRDFRNMCWMAIREKHNDTVTSWTIVRIKGEQGESGIKGEDAIPVRIRNWADIFASQSSEQGIFQPLTGNERIFSGYEEWEETVNGVTTTKKAPFRDVIIVTPEDYPSWLPCPSVTEDGVVTPALYVVNYRNPSIPNTCSAYASVGVPNQNPNIDSGYDLLIPHNSQSGTGADIKNWTVTLYQDKTSSEEAYTTYHHQWSVFTNLGAVYAQLLVATQAYIGSLTVDHLTTSIGTNSSIYIQGGLIVVKDANGITRMQIGKGTGDVTPVLKFFDASGNLLYDLGPNGIQWASDGAVYTDASFGNSISLVKLCELNGTIGTVWGSDLVARSKTYRPLSLATRTAGNNTVTYYNYNNRIGDGVQGHGWQPSSLVLDSQRTPAFTLGNLQSTLFAIERMYTLRPNGCNAELDVWPNFSGDILSQLLPDGWYLDTTEGIDNNTSYPFQDNEDVVDPDEPSDPNAEDPDTPISDEDYND